MRTAVGAAALGITLMAAAALAACSPQDPVRPPTALPSGGPVFESEEEALGAAEDAYGEYLAVSDSITASGGLDPERIADFVTDERLTSELDGFAVFADNGLHTSGNTTFENATLQQVSPRGDGVEVVFYACWDATAVRVLDQSELDVTPLERIERQTLEIVVVSYKSTNELLLESDDPWSQDSLC